MLFSNLTYVVLRKILCERLKYLLRSTDKWPSDSRTLSSTKRQQQLHRTTPLEAYEDQVRIILIFSALSTEEQDKHAYPTPKSHLVNKRFEGLLDRMRPNFQCFRIPFHFTFLYPDITAHGGCTSTHGGRNLSLNESSKSLPQAVSKSGKCAGKFLLLISIILVTWLCFWNATPKVFSSNHQRNWLFQTFFDFFHNLWDLS